MRRSVIIVFLVLVFSGIQFIAFLMYTEKSKPKVVRNKNQDKISSSVIVSDQDENYYSDQHEFFDDYEIGFQAGKFALYSQLEIDYEPKDDEVFAYSSFIQERKNPRYDQNEEYDRGYVDGYHRATEEISCPTSYSFSH